MPSAIDTITATVTAAAVAGSAAAAVAGDSLIIRSTAARVRLLNAWIDTDALGFVQITSPKLHDNTRGLRVRTTVHEPFPLLPYETMQDLYPVDTLAVTVASAAGAGKIDNTMLMVYYDDIAGIQQGLIDVPTLQKRKLETVTVEYAPGAPASGSTYSGLAAINASSDLLKRGSSYALVGYQVSANVTGLTIRGADSGNLRIPMPGYFPGGFLSGTWFYDLSRYYGLPLIPVFQANNSPGIFVEQVSNDLLAAITASLIFVRLG
ncbi:MAG TPA: hypothetical protein VE077_17640 [Candidatus Methylomirabilis sp.]|nr:hypothetical protein [Candidatus Methylomirabilis sp.]